MASTESLTGPARQVHQAVLAAFARTGQPPARSDLDRLARNLGASPDAVLAELAGAEPTSTVPAGGSPEGSAGATMSGEEGAAGSDGVAERLVAGGATGVASAGAGAVEGTGPRFGSRVSGSTYPCGSDATRTPM